MEMQSLLLPQLNRPLTSCVWRCRPNKTTPSCLLHAGVDWELSNSDYRPNRTLRCAYTGRSFIKPTADYGEDYALCKELIFLGSPNKCATTMLTQWQTRPEYSIGNPFGPRFPLGCHWAGLIHPLISRLRKVVHLSIGGFQYPCSSRWLRPRCQWLTTHQTPLAQLRIWWSSTQQTSTLC